MFSSDPNWQLIPFCPSFFVMSFNNIMFNLLNGVCHLGCTNPINSIWHSRDACGMLDSTSPLEHSLLKNPKEVKVSVHEYGYKVICSACGKNYHHVVTRPLIVATFFLILNRLHRKEWKVFWEWYFICPIFLLKMSICPAFYISLYCITLFKQPESEDLWVKSI